MQIILIPQRFSSDLNTSQLWICCTVPHSPKSSAKTPPCVGVGIGEGGMGRHSAWFA